MGSPAAIAAVTFVVALTLRTPRFVLVVDLDVFPFCGCFLDEVLYGNAQIAYVLIV